MKKIILSFVLLAACNIALAQFGSILDKAKKKAEDKTTNKAETAADKKVDDTMNGKSGSGDSGEGKASDASSGANSPAGTTSGIKVYSKFDFIPGEKIIVMEDFAQDAVGDFPDKWNTNASAEIVTVESLQGKWLKISKQGVLTPAFIDSLPDNFTLEYDLLCDNPGKVWSF